MKTRKVLHIISGLDTGGAEMMLYKLLVAFPEQEISSEVISLKDCGPIGKKISDLGINVQNLHLGTGWWTLFTAVFSLAKYVRRFNPDVIQGWMYHGNIAATVASVFVLNKATVCWNIRQTLQELNKEKILTRWLIRLSVPLSRLPKHILYNSMISADQHESFGFYNKSRVIIANGFDINKFRPQAKVRSHVRGELGLISEQIVGHIARYHPKKDHESLLKAARLIVNQAPKTIFLLIGRDVTTENRRLTTITKQLELEGNVRLLGERNDVSQLMAAMDVVVSSSAWGEGFPNVIGEAMASGVTCVVTDVGESKRIVGSTGKVVPNSSPEMVANAVLELLTLAPEKRLEIGSQARERIRRQFSIQEIAFRYCRIYSSDSEREKDSSPGTKG